MSLAAEPTQRTVSLVDADPELLRGVPEPDIEQLRHQGHLHATRLEPGEWLPGDRRSYGQAAFGLLVVGGLLTAETVLERRVTSRLHGPGDVIAPWDPPESLVSAPTRWLAGERTLLAILDERFVAITRRWPAVGVRLYERLVLQQDRLATHLALSHEGRVELRVLGVLWHLADRWGRVSADGIVVPLNLTHEALGRLIGAQRPSVTLALGQLEREGHVRKREDGAWVLSLASAEQLAGSPEAVPTAPAEALDHLRPRQEAPTGGPKPRNEVDLHDLRLLLDELRVTMRYQQNRLEHLVESARDVSARSSALREQIRLERAERERRRQELRQTPRAPSGR